MNSGFLKNVFRVDPETHILFVNCWAADLERLHGGDLRWPPIVLPAEHWTGFEEIVIWETDRNRVEYKLNLKGWQRLNPELNAWIPQVVAIEELLEPLPVSLSVEADANDLVNGRSDFISFVPMLEARAIPDALFDARDDVQQRAAAEHRPWGRLQKLDSRYYQEGLRLLLRQHDGVRWSDHWPATARAIIAALDESTTPQIFRGVDLEALLERSLGKGCISRRDIDQLRHRQPVGC